MFLCPSRRQAPQLCTDFETRNPYSGAAYQLPGAVSDYAACGGGNDSAFDQGLLQPAGSSTLVDTTNQIYSWTASTSFATATDGLSNTLLIGEKHIPTQDLNRADGAHDYADGACYNNDGIMWSVRIVGLQTQTVNVVSTGFSSWVTGVTAANPLAWPLGQGPTDTSQPYPGFRFGSYHPGVCQFVFGDGSVHALSNNTNIQTLTWLALPNDGQVVGNY
jgi:hypothetical protein